MVTTANETGMKFATILDGVRREADFKFDMMMTTRNLRMGDNGNLFSLSEYGKEGFEGSVMTEWAFCQLAGHLDIPVRFARKVPAELRAKNFNYFLERMDPDRQWLVRSYTHGNAGYGPLIRGFMSFDYTKFDDDLFLEMIGKCIGSDGDHQILLYHRDDKGMHMRIGFPDLQTNIGRLLDGKPDRHMVGIHVSNSEVGQKAVTVAPMVYRLVCTNGLIRWEADGDMFRQRHIHLRESEMFGRVAEAVTNAVQGGDKLLDDVATMKETEVSSPIDVIKKLAEQRKYTQKLKDAVVTAFHEEPGHTQFHTLQAFTRAARNLKGDERVEVERDASRLFKWKL